MDETIDDSLIREAAKAFMARQSREQGASLDEVLTHFPTLRSDEARKRLLETVAGLSRSADRAGNTTPEHLPSLEGYQIFDRLGAGGMGVVYEGFQDATGKRVAIKFLHASAAASESARRRFEREVEFAARLNHPNIVSVLDSGIHRGQYYYVMDFVEGVPLDEAFLPGRGDTRQVLQLMQRIAEVVDHAHQRGILHRDLKPANILIDSRGEPRILDFGLAKAVESDSQSARELTLSLPGELIGTLAYMSPEQARGDHQQIGVRSDVFSLGATAYQLLTGRLPCNLEGSLQQILERIATHDPVRASLTGRRFDVDVDAILSKALEKDPNRRYASALEFAADIGRYLNDRPILARRVGIVARAARWVRRHRTVSALSAIAVLVLAITVTLSYWRIRTETHRTQDKAEFAADAQVYFDKIFKDFSPDETKVSQAIELIDVYRNLDRKLIDEPPSRPEVMANVLATLGNNYRALDYIEDADRCLQRALEIRRSCVKAPDSELAQSLHDLAALRWDQARYTEAEGLYRAALEMRVRLYGDVHADVAMSQIHLAACLDKQQRHQEAEQLFRKGLATRVALLGPEHPDVIAARNNLGTCLRSQKLYQDAKIVFREVLESLAKSGSPDHFWIARAKHNLATCLIELKQLDEARMLLLEAIERKAERYGRNHHSVASSLYELARVELKTGNCQEAGRQCQAALEIQKEKLQPGHVDLEDSLRLMQEIEATCPADQRPVQSPNSAKTKPTSSGFTTPS